MEFIKLFESFIKSNKLINELTEDQYYEYINSHESINIENDIERIRSLLAPSNQHSISILEFGEFVNESPIYISSLEISVWKYPDDWYIITRFITKSDSDPHYYLVDGYDGLDKFFKEL